MFCISILLPTSDRLTALESEFCSTLSSQSWILTKVSASVISYTNRIPWMPLKYWVGMFLYFYWPAVSHSESF